MGSEKDYLSLISAYSISIGSSHVDTITILDIEKFIFNML
jgi:hypothetical protein